MKKIKYRQCELEKAEESATRTMVSFLPEKFAAVGTVLKLKDDDGNWSDGWIVKSAGQLTDEPPDWRKEVRAHRKTTGDSLPRTP